MSYGYGGGGGGYDGGGYKPGPCWDFQKGICNRGPACRFSHDEASGGGGGGFGGGAAYGGGGGFGGGGYGGARRRRLSYAPRGEPWARGSREPRVLRRDVNAGGGATVDRRARA